MAPLLELIAKLNSSDVPPVRCIVSDGVMSFGIEAGRLLGIPEFQFWTASACGFMCYLQYNELLKRGIVPFKGELSFVLYFCFRFGDLHLYINVFYR